MSDAARRIAALSPEQREALLRELARARQGTPAPASAALPPLVPRPAERYEPFPLTAVQEVYRVGRSGCCDLPTPGPGANVYMEYEIRGGGEPLLEQLEGALRRLFDHHEILRLVVLPDGRQRLLDPVPEYRIERIDLRSRAPEEAARATEETRERFRYHPGPPGTWPLFGFRAVFLPEGSIRLHIWIDCWLIDGLSRDNLVRDLFLLLASPAAELPPLGCTYRDYALWEKEVRASEAYRRAREHWLRRIPHLPAPPELPLATPLGPRTPGHFTDRVLPLLGADAWQRLQAVAQRLGVTPSLPLIAAFIEVLRAWTGRPAFLLALEGTYWPPVHPQLSELVGNFNTVYVLAADDLAGSFVERVRRLQRQLSDALDHRVFPGFEVLRELRRQRGGGTASLLPVNFNSLIEYNHPSYGRAQRQDERREERPPAPSPAGLGVAQVELGIHPPQLLLMPAVYETGGEIFLKVQTVEGVLPEGMAADLIDAYAGLVRRLAEGSGPLWEAQSFSLAPAAQLAQRNPERTAAEHPDAPALADLIHRLDLGPGDRLLPLSPSGTDLSRIEVLAARTAGATLTDSIAEATVWSAPPALLDRFLARLPAGGERLPLRLVLLQRGMVPLSLPDRLRALAPGVRIAALFGTPESGPAALHEIGDVPPGALRLPLGRPLAGVSLHVLDSNQAPRPDWVPGELWIGGPGEPLVRTGLWARCLPGGLVERLGREEDYRVEIAGRPVDPRWTEAALERHPEVRAAAVRSRPDARGRNRLEAWIVPAPGAAAEPGVLADALGALFPSYLVPACIHRREELPLDAAGEIDGRALLAGTEPLAPPLPAPPQSALERELSGLWTELLGAAPESLDDDFFALGGDSFSAVLLLERAAGRLGGPTGLAVLSPFFEEPTLRRLAALFSDTTNRQGN